MYVHVSHTLYKEKYFYQPRKILSQPKHALHPSKQYCYFFKQRFHIHDTVYCVPLCLFSIVQYNVFETNLGHMYQYFITIVE